MSKKQCTWMVGQNILHENETVGIIVVARKKLSKNRYAHHQLLRLAFLAKRVSISVFLWTIINMQPKKTVYGVGINDADYISQRLETNKANGARKPRRAWVCPYYQTWVDMLARCYSSKHQERRPTYKGCTVSAEWHTFSNFRAWMEAQNWEGKQLDKDLLFEGNKVYSADTCVFVTRLVNMFTTDRGSDRGEWKLGVSRDKRREKFRAQCSNPFSGKREFLGYFTCEQEAHNAWLKRKLELARLLAAEQTDPRVAKALVDRYSKTQEQLMWRN